jgi:hypothetical protein
MAILDSSQRRKGSSLGRWALLAALIHVQLLLVAGVVLHIWAPRDADILAAQKRAADKGAGEPISVSTVDDDTARKLIADMERLEEKAKEEQAKKEEEAAKAPGQVVDLARPREEKRPENARFAAEYDSAVEHQTRKYGRFDPNELQRSRGDSDRNRAAVPEQAGSPKPPGAGALAMRTPPRRRPSAFSTPGDSDREPGDPGERYPGPWDPEGLFAPPGGGGPRKVAPLPSEGGPPLSPGQGIASLIPSEEEVARAIGSGTQDYLRDVDEGEETALNAKKWKFATFFNRVNEQVHNHW